jgi:NADH:ubiquinone oxidoreductase subunit K
MSFQLLLFLSLALFSIGLYGVLSRQHLIGILIGVELMLNAASLNLMTFNYFVVHNPAVGQIFVLFVIGLAAAEAAIALSITLLVYRNRHTADVDRLTDLRG